ncbi:MAG TPA: YciI family protein [Ktedonosporobacter sp.]|nr:YciI family protein [Ktedonosporobacter sp.]
MRYLALIYQDDVAHAKWSQEELAAEQNAYWAFNSEAGSFLVGNGIALMDSNTATTVRVRNGQTLRTQGPFAETKEQCCGYYLLNCKDLDEAVEVAAKIPTAKNGSVEIRPIVEFS